MRYVTLALLLSSAGAAATAAGTAFAEPPAATATPTTTAAPTTTATPVAAPAPAMDAPAPQTRQIVLAAHSDIPVTPDTSISSKTAKQGDTFTLKTVNDVLQDGLVVIPAGTPGTGTVTAIKKPGSFGKSGKMEIAFTSLDLMGQSIPLSGKFQQQGQGNGGATAGAIVAAGLVGGFLVSGHSAVIEHGVALHAQTAADQTITLQLATAQPAGTMAAAH
ncbi:hypothetical protein [Novosphingobium sp.]|uniref:hypothetical protein n=1 Tax=Novosphingobium sp. TaxID=1874826 RepID=UPI0033410A94